MGPRLHCPPPHGEALRDKAPDGLWHLIALGRLPVGLRWWQEVVRAARPPPCPVAPSPPSHGLWTAERTVVVVTLWSHPGEGRRGTGAVSRQVDVRTSDLSLAASAVGLQPRQLLAECRGEHGLPEVSEPAGGCKMHYPVPWACPGGQDAGTGVVHV